MNFNANEVKTAIIEWIQKFFKENGRGCKAVVGISGGRIRRLLLHSALKL